MKKTVLFLFVICVACSFVFAGNIGDYSIAQIKNAQCKAFVNYLNSKGYFNPDSDVVIPDYGFYLSDEGNWQVRISDFTDFSMITITFCDDSISMVRWANFDLSGYKLIDILTAVNDATYNHENYGAVGYSSEVSDLYYTSRFTNQLTPEAIMDQLYWVGVAGAEVFTEIQESLNK